MGLERVVKFGVVRFETDGESEEELSDDEYRIFCDVIDAVSIVEVETLCRELNGSLLWARQLGHDPRKNKDWIDATVTAFSTHTGDAEPTNPMVTAAVVGRLCDVALQSFDDLINALKLTHKVRSPSFV